jgi:hypothetical protein
MKLTNAIFLGLFLFYNYYNCINCIKVLKEPRPGCLWTYESCDQTGKYKEYCSPKGKTIFKINDIVGSIKLGPSTVWGLSGRGKYTHPYSKPSQQPPCFVIKRFRKYKKLQVNFYDSKNLI